MWVDLLFEKMDITKIFRLRKSVVCWRCHRKFDRDFAFDLQK